MNKKRLLSIVVLMGIMLVPSASMADTNEIGVIHHKNKVITNANNIVIASEAESVIMNPRYEECACGGKIFVKKMSESSWGRGARAECSHGLNGYIWEKTIFFEKLCSTCDYGTTFTETQEEVRCSH